MVYNASCFETDGGDPPFFVSLSAIVDLYLIACMENFDEICTWELYGHIEACSNVIRLAGSLSCLLVQRSCLMSIEVINENAIKFHS